MLPEPSLKIIRLLTTWMRLYPATDTSSETELVPPVSPVTEDVAAHAQLTDTLSENGHLSRAAAASVASTANPRLAPSNDQNLWMVLGPVT